MEYSSDRCSSNHDNDRFPKHKAPKHMALVCIGSVSIGGTGGKAP